MPLKRGTRPVFAPGESVILVRIRALTPSGHPPPFPPLTAPPSPESLSSQGASPRSSRARPGPAEGAPSVMKTLTARICFLGKQRACRPADAARKFIALGPQLLC